MNLLVLVATVPLSTVKRGFELEYKKVFVNHYFTSVGATGKNVEVVKVGRVTGRV